MPLTTDWLPAPGEILSVEGLLGGARRLVESGYPSVWVEGEIGNCRIPASGHAYFTLADGAAQVRAVAFRSALKFAGVSPRDGIRVLARGRLTVYEARGDLQLVVEGLEPAGEGRLRREWEERKGRLAAEGLFAAERKRPLPPLPRAVGVVTSPTGAAVRDVLQVLGRRAPGVHVLVSPARVQGEGAAAELVAALALAAAHPEVDVVVLGRGGGSAEDLGAFNDEDLVRAVATCRVPVIAAVGHETDVTLVDFAADVRAPTPSAAAELAVREWGAWVDRVARAEEALARAVAGRLTGARRRLAALDPWARSPLARLDRWRLRVDRAAAEPGRAVEGRLRHARGACGGLEARLGRFGPEDRLGWARERLAAMDQRLGRGMGRALETRRQAVAAAGAELGALSPLGVLARGYAVVRGADRRVVREARTLAVGDAVGITVARGGFAARVVDTTPAPEE